MDGSKHAGEKGGGVEIGGRDGRAHGATLADGQGQRAGVDVLDCDDAALAEEVGQTPDRLPVAGLAAHVVHDEATQVQVTGLHVPLVDAIVSDLGVGQRDDLAGVGRIAHDLLVADHRGVEDDLAEGLAGRACRTSLQHHAVLEGQKRPVAAVAGRERAILRLGLAYEQVHWQIPSCVAWRSRLGAPWPAGSRGSAGQKEAPTSVEADASDGACQVSRAANALPLSVSPYRP